MEQRLQPLDNGMEIYVSESCGFGEDAVLLARFGAPASKERVCDLGTGSGILPLLWCTHTPPAHIDAVERQPDAAMMAARSVAHNRLEARIQVICADWRQAPSLLPSGSYDRVTCNPPYFPPHSGKPSAHPAVCAARHEESPCTLRELTAAAATLLRNGGRFCLCHRPERLCDVLGALRGARLEPKQLQLVQTTVDTPPWLLLCEAKKGAHPGLKLLPPLLTRTAGSFT